MEHQQRRKLTPVLVQSLRARDFFLCTTQPFPKKIVARATPNPPGEQKVYPVMYQFHHDRRRYFDIQAMNSRNSIVPFVKNHFPLPVAARILEIGCGEGGVLKAFIEKGYTAVGIELMEARVTAGRLWMKDEIENGCMKFIIGDIFSISSEQLNELFDVIILKDVIEHLPDKEILLFKLKTFLRPGGIIFFGFPPWQMPFGGHQQLCRNKYLSKLPWLHLLPRPIYKSLLASCKNEPVDELMMINDTRISIEHFQRLINSTGYSIIAKKYYLIAPIYQHKFGWKEREQLRFVGQIPYIRNFFTTAAYYLIVSRNK